MEQKLKFDVSIWTIIKIAVAIAIIWAIYNLRDVLIFLFAVVIFAAALRPTVNNWSKVIGRKLAVSSVVFLIVAVLVVTGYLILPPLVEETTSLVNAIPGLVSQYSHILDNIPYLESGINNFSQYFGEATTQIVSIALNIVGGIFTLILALVLTIYFLLDESILKHLVVNFAPKGKEEKYSSMIDEITSKIGSWLRGEFFLMLIIGIASYIFLRILNIPYALPLAVISGLLELVPTVGPIVSGIIATIAALTVSPLLALITGIFYIVLQQLENILIVPKVMQKAVGLPPVVIIVAIIIAAALFGIIGALLAVPVVAASSILYKEWIKTRSTRGE